MPEISIVVPVYKIEKYISACIDSILAQSFQNIELILVDDGSPDNCGNICDSYAAQDKRIRVIHQKNAGLSCARNAGATVAQGRYLSFVDGDDLLCENFCKDLYELLEGAGCDFSACAVCRFDDGKEPNPHCPNNEPLKMNNADYLKAQLSRQREFGVWNRLYRREVFEQIQFYPGKIHEDVIFAADVAQLHGGVIVTDKQLYCYRQRNSGIVAQSSLKCSPDRIFAGEYLVEVTKKKIPELYNQSLKYAVDYPWTFVDGIFIDRTFRENKAFLIALRDFIRRYKKDLLTIEDLNPLVLARMNLFSKSNLLYGFNAYSRLLRVYLFHIFGKDAYSDGHGI